MKKERVNEQGKLCVGGEGRLKDECKNGAWGGYPNPERQCVESRLAITSESESTSAMLRLSRNPLTTYKTETKQD